MTELKPCPFCGGEAQAELCGKGIFAHWVVICDKCGANIQDNNTEYEATEAWNKRTPENTCTIQELSALEQTLSMVNTYEWGECSDCGYITPTDSEYCMNCGAKVKQ